MAIAQPCRAFASDDLAYGSRIEQSRLVKLAPASGIGVATEITRLGWMGTFSGIR